MLAFVFILLVLYFIWLMVYFSCFDETIEQVDARTRKNRGY